MYYYTCIAPQTFSHFMYRGNSFRGSRISATWVHGGKLHKPVQGNPRNVGAVWYPTATCMYLYLDFITQWYHSSDVDHVVTSNLIGLWGPACYLCAWKPQGLGRRLVYLLTQSGPDTSGGPMADGVHGINAWCSRERRCCYRSRTATAQYHVTGTGRYRNGDL